MKDKIFSFLNKYHYIPLIIPMIVIIVIISIMVNVRESNVESDETTINLLKNTEENTTLNLVINDESTTIDLESTNVENYIITEADTTIEQEITTIPVTTTQSNTTTQVTTIQVTTTTMVQTTTQQITTKQEETTTPKPTEPPTEIRENEYAYNEDGTVNIKNSKIYNKKEINLVEKVAHSEDLLKLISNYSTANLLSICVNFNDDDDRFLFTVYLSDKTYFYFHINDNNDLIYGDFPSTGYRVIYNDPEYEDFICLNENLIVH